MSTIKFSSHLNALKLSAAASIARAALAQMQRGLSILPDFIQTAEERRQQEAYEQLPRHQQHIFLTWLHGFGLPFTEAYRRALMEQVPVSGLLGETGAGSRRMALLIQAREHQWAATPSQDTPSRQQVRASMRRMRKEHRQDVKLNLRLQRQAEAQG